jgi:Arc/MetJ-type ribon-helix-helix transcriptional regulator
MVLKISPRNEARIIGMVEGGKYSDVDALIDDALALLDERERFNHLRKLLAVGAEQAARGELIPYDDEFRAEARRVARERLAAGEKPSPDVCP